MTDRVPANPNRRLIIPEDGAPPFYATIERADNPIQEGTLLDKAALLKDATAALYGLTSAAVPDDVLKKARELITAAQNTANSASSTANQVYSRARIEIGSAVATDTGVLNLSFGIPWKLFILASGYSGFCTNSMSSFHEIVNNVNMPITKSTYSLTINHTWLRGGTFYYAVFA